MEEETIDLHIIKSSFTSFYLESSAVGNKTNSVCLCVFAESPPPKPLGR